MTATQSLKIYEILQRHFNNNADAQTLVEEIQQVVENKFEDKKHLFSSKSEVELLRRDVETMKIELSSKIENSSLRVESNLKSEINKLIILIIATMLTSGALFITLAKVFFDK
ncbi:MAG TPA: hypothetical protein VF623_00735 [Segetibacter sp.]